MPYQSLKSPADLAKFAVLRSQQVLLAGHQRARIFAELGVGQDGCDGVGSDIGKDQRAIS